jgi:putative tryptophan/tyrosine transport system substrate-binding protein
MLAFGRRNFVLALGGIALTGPSAAQKGRKIPRVGILWHTSSATEEEPYFSGVMQGFADIGYHDGQNIVIEHRFPNETPERFRSMAAELAASNLDVIVTIGTAPAPYAKAATSTVPIVFALVADPVGSKLVESVAHPGGNATALSTFAPDLIGKRMQFLRQTIPGLRGVAILINPNNAAISARYLEVTQAAGAELGLAVHAFDVRSLADFEPAFNEMAKADVQAVMNNSDGLMVQARFVTAKLAIERRLAFSGYSRETLEAGALMSYGADLVGIAKHTAVVVDRILKGEKPGDLPVEQPTKFEFLINLKTAKTLGLAVPPTLLALADGTIE